MRRSEFVKFRAAPEAIADWRSAAADVGMNLSAWLRGVADIAAVTGGNPVAVRLEVTALRTSLNRGVGNNLNQLAASVNSGALTGSPQLGATLTRATDELARMREALEKLLRSDGQSGKASGQRNAPAAQPAGHVKVDDGH